MSRAYAEAELEYAKTPRDGVLEYAQKMKSSSQKHDGLYGEGDTQNLISNDFANAVASGKPFHGYYFKILTAQGASAPGGALNYVVNGRMIGGFALVAWPAEYEVSGVKTFVISYDGIVFEKDFGSKTSVLVSQMSRFDPDSSWREVRGE